MDDLTRGTMIKAAIPVLTAAGVLVAARRRGISWREHLGFRAPGVTTALGWLGFWIGWIVLSEVVIRVFHLEQASPWPEYPGAIVLARIVTIGLLGPFVEELVMRGLLLHVLGRTAIREAGAVVVTAVAWAALHYRYGPGTTVLITADGLLYGLARVRGGSLWLPIGMHGLANCISVFQSLSG